MSQDEQNQSDQSLETFFAATKAADPVPKADLMARVLADAARVQAGFPTASGAIEQPTGRRFFAEFADLIGGWAGGSALTACVCIGLLYGFSAPETVRSYLPEAVNQTVEADYSYLDVLDDTAAELEG